MWKKALFISVVVYLIFSVFLFLFKRLNAEALFYILASFPVSVWLLVAILRASNKFMDKDFSKLPTMQAFIDVAQVIEKRLPEDHEVPAIGRLAPAEEKECERVWLFSHCEDMIAYGGQVIWKREKVTDRDLFEFRLTIEGWKSIKDTMFPYLPLSVYEKDGLKVYVGKDHVEWLDVRLLDFVIKDFINLIGTTKNMEVK